MSSKLEAYEAAYERLTLEKTAEAYAEAYGTEDGYLPEAYLGAFIELEKEAHVEMMVNAFAPETGYIPAAYVEALEKEAGFVGDMITRAGKFLSTRGGKGLGQQIGSGAVKQTGKGGVSTMKLGPNAGFMDTMKFHGNKAMSNVGTFMKNNPTATAVGLGGMAGTGAVGLGTGYMMRGGNK